MLPGAVIAAQGAEIVVAERLDAGFGIDLGGREIQVVEGFRFCSLTTRFLLRRVL
jgi:hypothetical protein